jgi:hypothetical protein
MGVGVVRVVGTYARGREHDLYIIDINLSAQEARHRTTAARSEPIHIVHERLEYSVQEGTWID